LRKSEIKVKISSDRSVSVEFANEISVRINREIRAFMMLLGDAEILGIVEVVPTYRAVLIHYEPDVLPYDELIRHIYEIIEKTKDIDIPRSEVVEVPVCYGGEYGPDIATVAKNAGISEKKVIEIHTQPAYLIYMLGFTPGFAYMGGMNIGDEYMGLKKTKPWRDTHLRITGDAVELIFAYFCFDWDFSARDNLTKELEKISLSKRDTTYEPLPIQIVSQGPDSPDEEIKNGIIKMLYSARKYAYIQSPYFIPDQSFRNALVTAAKSGVDVKVMIPGIPDKKYVYYSSLSYVEEMIRAGVKIYLYNGFIHAKTCVVDDEIATIGSTNIDIRSFSLHFELNAFFYQEKFSEKCREIFEVDTEKSRLLTLEEYHKRPLLFKIKEGFFRLFSQIM